MILTQPPFDWAMFDRWMYALDRCNVVGRSRIVVGIPMVTSSANLAFWYHLVGGDLFSKGATAELLDTFKDEEEKGKASFLQFCRRWNRELVEAVQQLPGVGGLHVMPLSKLARTITLELIRDGVLC